MQIVFDKDKANVVFAHESMQEYRWLTKFTAFTRSGFYFCVPAILPIVHNVLERVKISVPKTFRIKVSEAVFAFLEQDFKLLPIPALFEYHTKPKDFQEIALRFLYTLGSAGILLDPGMGKSKVVLDYIHLMGFEKVIIICPCALLFVWEDEIAKHRPELSFHTVLTTEWDKEKPGIDAAQVTIINYTKVSLLLAQLEKIPYKFIHVDEFLIKDPTTNRTRHITQLASKIPFRCGGSGTLINNSALDAFSPVRYLQPSLVGHTYYPFLERYTVQKKVVGTTRKVVVAVKGQSEVKSILESCCIVMTKEKWLKLPPKIFKDVIVPMTPEQREAYFTLMSNFYLNVDGKDLFVDNQLVMLAKLYQIANGFVYLNPEDPSETATQLLLEEVRQPVKAKKKAPLREVYRFANSKKAEALTKILTEDLAGKKAIIWFNMSGELDQIKEAIASLGHKHLIIQGGEKAIGTKVRSFNKDASIRWLICQAQSVNYGITVLGSKKADLEAEGLDVFPDLDSSVCNEVFFSLSFSLERYLQQQDRIHRLGQDHTCTYYRIFSDAPVERKIRESIENKLSIKEEMLVDVIEELLSESGPGTSSNAIPMGHSG